MWMEDYFLSTCSLFRGHIDSSGVFPKALSFVAAKNKSYPESWLQDVSCLYHTTSTKAQVLQRCFLFSAFFCGVGSSSIRLKASKNDGIHNVLLDLVLESLCGYLDLLKSFHLQKKGMFWYGLKGFFVYPRHPNMPGEGMWTPKSKLKYQTSGGMTGWLGLNKKQMKRTLIEICKRPLVQKPYVRKKKGVTCHTFVLTTASFGTFEFYCT